MGFSVIQSIPSPEEIIEEIPLPEDLRDLKIKRDAEIRDIFEGKSSKFLLIIGPCSAHNEDAVCEYVTRLAGLQEEVESKILMVPRVYTNKPRTTGEGYKGMGHQPDPEKEPNIVEGLRAIRGMHIRVLKESHLPTADEMLYPENFPYLEDVLSYVAVGARSVENQQHRLTISGLDVPAGMKNPTGGDLSVMFNAIHAAQIPHIFIYKSSEVQTDGNPLAHAVLRGAVDPAGHTVANYHYEDLIRTAETYRDREFRNPTIIVDTNHCNSAKAFDQQPRIGMEVVYSRRSSEILQEMVRGLMVESYLEEGSQKVEEGVFGKSITDPCLGWDDTVTFVRDLADTL
jgi:3-deoxy-7-phosphoheptulonate synthase